jgi:predicted DNA-binding transcriptional regulator AlpA
MKPENTENTENTKKILIVDLEATMKLLGCSRANVYGYYLKKRILSPVPRVGKKAYFYYDEVSKLLNEELADVAARKNLKLSTKKMDNYKLITQDFLDTYTELTHK